MTTWSVFQNQVTNEIESVNPEASLARDKGKPSVSCESSILCESSVSHNHESRLIIKGATTISRSRLHDDHKNVMRADESCTMKLKLSKITLLKFNGEVTRFKSFRESSRVWSTTISTYHRSISLIILILYSKDLQHAAFKA